MKLLCVFFVASLLSGCGSSSVPIIFEPVASPTLTTIYSNGIPIVRPTTDSLSFLLSFDYVFVGNTPYFRLWVLCQNNSNSTLLLEPSRVFTFVMAQKNSPDQSLTANTKPELSSNLLSKIEAEKNAQSFLGAISGSLQAASTQNTTISSNTGNTYQINDAAEKRKTVYRETSSTLASISNWYEVFKQSVSSGVLRKNTLFPGQSVNGYVYFENQIYTTVRSRKWVFNLQDYQFELQMEWQDKIQKIPFVATKGE